LSSNSTQPSAKFLPLLPPAFLRRLRARGSAGGVHRVWRPGVVQGSKRGMLRAEQLLQFPRTCSQANSGLGGAPSTRRAS